MNTDGILKNRDAGIKESVKVNLWLFDGEKEIVLCREQKKDELNSMSSKITLDKDEEKAKAEKARARKIAQEYIKEHEGNLITLPEILKEYED